MSIPIIDADSGKLSGVMKKMRLTCVLVRSDKFFDVIKKEEKENQQQPKSIKEDYHYNMSKFGKEFNPSSKDKKVVKFKEYQLEKDEANTDMEEFSISIIKRISSKESSVD